MTPTGTRPPPTRPDDPVRAALDDADVRVELGRHAQARLSGWLADRPVATRAEAVQEAVQETVKRVLEQSDRFDPTKAAVAAWIHGVLEHVLHERCRDIRMQPAQPSSDPAAWDALAARLANDDGSLNELLAALPQEQREIVAMFHLEEMSHIEIAAELGISIGNSRVKLARAMTALKELAAKGGGR